MTISRLELATTLFDQLSENLATIRPELQGLVKCPLCERDFDRSALLRDDEDGLTLDHIIPDALGGWKVTLTCRKCNNTDGSTLDAHFVRMIGAHDWFDGDGSLLRGNIKLEDGDLPVLMSLPNRDNESLIKILGGKPDVLGPFQASPASFVERDTTFTVNLEFNHVKAQRAVLRMGFLVLCHTLGYAYTLSGAANRVRTLIRGNEVDALSHFVFRFDNIKEGPRPMPPITTVSVGDGQAYFVLFKIAAIRTWYFAVLLPSAEIAEDAVFDVISKLRDTLHSEGPIALNVRRPAE